MENYITFFSGFYEYQMNEDNDLQYFFFAEAKQIYLINYFLDVDDLLGYIKPTTKICLCIELGPCIRI